MDFGTDDAHLDEQITLGIRAGADCAFKVHAEYPYGIARTYILGGEFFLWFLFGDRLCHFLFGLVETLAELLAFTLNCGSIHVIIMEFMEKLHRLISIILGFLENLVSFFIGLADDAVFLYIQFFLFGFKLFLKVFDLEFVLCDLSALVLNRDTAFFERSQHILKRFILLVDLFSGFLDDGCRNTELGRNRKCITLTRDTDQKTISRAQGFYIEFAACILDTGGRERKYFELTVMSGSHGADSSVMKIGEDGDRKCGTLCRVSSGTELIKQNEGILICFFEEGNDICHMGGEGT